MPHEPREPAQGRSDFPRQRPAWPPSPRASRQGRMGHLAAGQPPWALMTVTSMRAPSAPLYRRSLKRPRSDLAAARPQRLAQHAPPTLWQPLHWPLGSRTPAPSATTRASHDPHHGPQSQSPPSPASPAPPASVPLPAGPPWTLLGLANNHKQPPGGAKTRVDGAGGGPGDCMLPPLAPALGTWADSLLELQAPGSSGWEVGPGAADHRPARWLTRTPRAAPHRGAAVTRPWPRAAGLQEAQIQGRGHTKAGGRKPGRQRCPALLAGPPACDPEWQGPRTTALEAPDPPRLPKPTRRPQSRSGSRAQPLPGSRGPLDLHGPLPPGLAGGQLPPAPSERQQRTTSPSEALSTAPAPAQS